MFANYPYSAGFFIFSMTSRVLALHWLAAVCRLSLHEKGKKNAKSVKCLISGLLIDIGLGHLVGGRTGQVRPRVGGGDREPNSGGSLSVRGGLRRQQPRRRCCRRSGQGGCGGRHALRGGLGNSPVGEDAVRTLKEFLKIRAPISASYRGRQTPSPCWDD